MEVLKTTSTPDMNTTQRTEIMQRWHTVQYELMPELRDAVGALTPKLEQVVHTLEWVRIEEFVKSSCGGCGRPELDRGMLANAFVAKAVLGLPSTVGLIERLAIDRALRRICGFPMWRKGEIREVTQGKLEQQQGKPLAQLIKELPQACDRGSKCNAQGYKNSWNGYKLHIDTADCGIPVSALLSSASMHDSLAAMPLSLTTAERVTNCYDLMDAAYCSSVLREHSRSLGHVPLIDHNPRKGEKIEFTSSEAQRYKERTQAERTNGRLKDDFGGRHIRVRGHAKVMSHLMFGILALTADQLLRLLT